MEAGKCCVYFFVHLTISDSSHFGRRDMSSAQVLRVHAVKIDGEANAAFSIITINEIATRR